MFNDQILGKRLSKLHEATGDSQEDVVKDFAVRTGVSVHQTTFSGYLRGAKFPTLPVLAALADYYNVSIDYLLGRTDDERPAMALTQQVDRMSLPEGVERAARLMAQLPPEQQRRWEAIIEGEYREREERKQNAERWERLSKLVGLMDNTGALRSRIESETGVSLPSGN